MTPSPTLAAIVDANPASVRILERHQLDYCCGGRRTREQACAERDLDPAAALAELGALQPAAAAASRTRTWPSPNRWPSAA